MTEFVMKEFEAMDKFQHDIDKYGLTVNRRCTGGYYEGHGTEVFILNMRTENHPVKGNKAMIEQLRADGFSVEILGGYRMPRVFIVTQSARIITK